MAASPDEFILRLPIEDLEACKRTIVIVMNAPFVILI